ncbi:MAG: hypothetical protein HY815_07735 [Candidatus Riflebacteria bacterium]|nr:hypothetical protein [Candidatus Riflebacteria bacterium]
MNAKQPRHLGMIIVFILLVASLVYHQSSLTERLQQAKQGGNLADLPQVVRWNWPSLSPPSPPASPPPAQGRNLFF